MTDERIQEVNNVQEETVQTAEKPMDALDELFAGRTAGSFGRPPKDEEPDPKKERAPEKEETTDKPLGKASADEEDASEETDDRASHEEISKIRSELEKAQKMGRDHQKFAHRSRHQLSQVKKLVQSFTEDGTLTQSEAKVLLETMAAEPDDADLPEESQSSQHPFAPIFKIANQELENLRKYSNDSQLTAKINAFDYFLAVAEPQEVETAYGDLMELIDDPLALTRKMLEIGQTAYEDSYEEIQNAGGFKAFVLKKKEEVEKLKKKIDKLEKKLSQYEDYDKPNARIAETGEVEEPSSKMDAIDEIFAARKRNR